MARRIYFDTSALSRPFDDQGQLRIRLEAEAIEHLLRAVRERSLEWISSDIVMFEVRKCPGEERRELLELLCRRANERVALSEAVSQRARELRAKGLRDMDALHLAAAEQAGAEVLLTTDDRFVRAALAVRPASRVRVENPVIFGLEVFQ
jgi:predicted nucleic acid-binding protein